MKSTHPAPTPTHRNKQAAQPESRRDGRRYSVSSLRGKARGKIRYIETNDPKKFCRFL